MDGIRARLFVLQLEVELRFPRLSREQVQAVAWRRLCEEVRGGAPPCVPPPCRCGDDH